MWEKNTGLGVRNNGSYSQIYHRFLGDLSELGLNSSFTDYVVGCQHYNA